jgi:hypothetical protein
MAILCPLKMAENGKSGRNPLNGNVVDAMKVIVPQWD